MVFADALTKATRLIELQTLFCRHPARVWSTRDLSSRLGVTQRTVRNYLLELSGSGRPPVIREHRRWHLVPEARFEIPPVSFLRQAAARDCVGSLPTADPRDNAAPGGSRCRRKKGTDP
jgi:hypothetical protein